MQILHDWVDEIVPELEAEMVPKPPKWVPPKETEGCVLTTPQMLMFTGAVLLAGFGVYKMVQKAN